MTRGALKAEKRCSSCKLLLPRASFSSYRYVTNQGQDSIRLDSRCKQCRDAARLRKTDKKWPELRKEPPLLAPGKRICFTCEEVKDESEFHRHSTGKNQLRPSCKICHIASVGSWVERNRDKARASVRASTLRRRYGLSVAQFESMVLEQDGKCAICRTDAKLNVDHCHMSGAVRKLLCTPCNTVLGFIKEDRNIALAIVDYIDKYKVRGVA